MANLTSLLDAARAADTEKNKFLEEFVALANEGTEESIKKANDLRPTLDAAKKNADEANDRYVSARNASLTNDNMASLFVPPADPAQQTQSDEPKVMTRAEFSALSPAEQKKFALSGGKITD